MLKSFGLAMLNKSIEVGFISTFIPFQPFLYNKQVLLYINGLKHPISKYTLRYL